MLKKLTPLFFEGCKLYFYIYDKIDPKNLRVLLFNYKIFDNSAVWKCSDSRKNQQIVVEKVISYELWKKSTKNHASY
jgi:hypothetical protein